MGRRTYGNTWTDRQVHTQTCGQVDRQADGRVGQTDGRPGIQLDKADRWIDVHRDGQTGETEGQIRKEDRKGGEKKHQLRNKGVRGQRTEDGGGRGNKT